MPTKARTVRWRYAFQIGTSEAKAGTEKEKCSRRINVLHGRICL